MKALSFIVTLILLATAASAQETAMIVETSFFADGSARIDNVSVTLASIDQENQRPLAHAVQLTLEGQTLYETHVPVTFTLLDVQKPLRMWTVTNRLPYPGNRGQINVLHDDRVIASFDLKRLCTRNDRCEAFENSITCQDDCPIESPDAICLPYKDGSCDPDCANDLDTDCLMRAKQAGKGIPWPAYIIGLTLIVYLAYFFYTQRR